MQRSVIQVSVKRFRNTMTTTTATSTRTTTMTKQQNRFFGLAQSRIEQQQQQQQQSKQQYQQQRRSMVMVTKTKSSDLPKDDDNATSTSTTTSSPTVNGSVKYNYLSDVLNVTPSCLARIERLIQQRKKSNNNNESNDSNTTSYFLRVYVDAGGCSGFQYQFEVDHEMDPEEDTIVVEGMIHNDGETVHHHPRVVVDEASLNYLQGSTLDYVQEMIKSSFVVTDNPQSESACGCGSSFAMKNFASNPALD